MNLVVHCKKAPFDVYIGRPSKWGNPFSMSRFNRRYDVIRAYRGWIVKQPLLMNSLHELKGKTLGCWCAPMPCHGDVLAELANNLTQPEISMEKETKHPMDMDEDLTAALVLDHAKVANLAEVIVIGVEKSGLLYLSSTQADHGQSMSLVNRGRDYLVNAAIAEDQRE